MPREQIEQRVWLDGQVRRDIFEKSRHKCARCGRILAYKDMTVDHVIPLSKGGTNDPTNLVCLCEECNKKKSNDIVDPKDYFGYLPDPDATQRMFEDYLESTDWLQRDCLIPIDHFTLDTCTAVYMERQRRVYRFPATVHVDKMTQEEAFDFLQGFKEHLTPLERDSIVKSVDDLVVPHYKVTQNGRTLFVFAACIDKQDDNSRPCEFMQTTSGSKNSIDLTVTSNIEYMKTVNLTRASGNIAEVIKAVIGEIQKTLRKHAPKSVMDIMTRCMYSDDVMVAALATINHQDPTKSDIKSAPQNGKDMSDGGQVALKMILTQYNLNKEMNVRKPKAKDVRDYVKEHKLQASIDDQIKNERTIEQKRQIQHRKSKRKKRT
ncbi:MAG: HNH endonuclease [Clostridia bacterium]|nr:HNH endonuclease [Clostridia bacterium]